MTFQRKIEILYLLGHLSWIDKILILSYINDYCQKKIVNDMLEIKLTKKGEDVVAEIRKLELFKDDFNKIQALSKISKGKLEKANQQWVIF